ncbi:bromodomain testis-specific protein-like [Drosophila madeirensis]|uniref:Bromodomain testis-specific protein-like n=1 Tax=Drosophila madeirensis TaxID=30013 RepID=A0AAU9FXU5_DROMD
MDDRRREDFAKALFVLENQDPREQRPPRCEPRVQPVNGIVQPPVMPPPNRKGRVTNFLLKLRTAVNALSRNPSSLHFRQPVDAVKLNIRDYYEKIANPMDLNTIKKRFEYTYYWGGADVLEDILLIFENCRTYNSPDSTEFKAAVTLCECFWLRMAKMQQELHNECRAEAKTRRPRKASISKTSPLPKTPRQEKAVIPKKTNVEIKDLNQPKADDPLPSFEAVPNQHPNRRHCKQFTPVTPARRGRGRPPGPRSLTRADADRNAVISQEFPALQRPPNLLTNYGTQEKIDPLPVEPVLDQLSIKAILMPLNLKIERTYSQTLIQALRCCADSWPFNNSFIWMHFGENPHYDFHYEPLDWDILEKMLAGEQFKGWDWLLIKLHRMLENAMSCFTVCPSVRTATLRTFEKFVEMITDYEERMAHVKATAYEAVRLKLDAMTPSQKAAVETEPYEEDDSLRIITNILGKTQLMHYLQPPDISIYVDTLGDCSQLWDSNVDDLTLHDLQTVMHIALQHNVPVTMKNGRMDLSITKFSPKVISILNEALLQHRRLDYELLQFMTADEQQVMMEVLENRLLKLNTLLNISNRSGTLGRHATPSNSQDLEPSGLATMAKMARLSDDEEEEKGGGKHDKKGET